MTTSKRKKALRKLHQQEASAIEVTIKDMKQLNNVNIDSCGYLRKPRYDGSYFYGTCALLDFDKCDYPCDLPILAFGKYENFKCPTYNHFMKTQQ